jgi:DNA-binding transcriptional regulator YiaG
MRNVPIFTRRPRRAKSLAESVKNLFSSVFDHLRTTPTRKLKLRERGQELIKHVELATQRLHVSVANQETWLASHQDTLTGRDTNEVWAVEGLVSFARQLITEAVFHLDDAKARLAVGEKADEPIRAVCQSLLRAKVANRQLSRMINALRVGHISIPLTWEETVQSWDVPIKCVVAMKTKAAISASELHQLIVYILRWLSLTKDDLADMLGVQRSDVDAWLAEEDLPDQAALHLLTPLKCRADQTRRIRAIIDSLRQWLGLTETTLADRLEVQQCTVSKWYLGRRVPSDNHMAALKALFEEAHHAIAHTLLQNTDFQLECNFSDKYPEGFAQEAKANLDKLILDSAPVPAGTYLNLLIRSAELPVGVDAQCFSDSVRNPRTFLVLVSSQLPASRQMSVAWQEVHAHVTTRTTRSTSKRPEPTPLL